MTAKRTQLSQVVLYKFYASGWGLTQSRDIADDSSMQWTTPTFGRVIRDAARNWRQCSIDAKPVKPRGDSSKPCLFHVGFYASCWGLTQSRDSADNSSTQWTIPTFGRVIRDWRQCSIDAKPVNRRGDSSEPCLFQVRRKRAAGGGRHE
ncbi:hypothetical protein Q1695_008217 [Nippostrongylus brasiliensis]|nr:hypothetical protein Q1695_008217 [Nippostrongylus brasiliensis]